MPWDGPTHGKALFALVGEAPGANEDRQGTPFVGKAGAKLDQALEIAGVTRSEVAILNTLCCRPPNNRDPQLSESLACEPNFQAQLSIIGTGFGVAMGGFAAAAVLGEPRGSIQIGSLRGQVAWRHGMVWGFTYHPAYILRNPSKRSLLVEDLGKAAQVARGDLPIPKESKDLTAPDSHGMATHELQESLRKRGWATMNLRTIGVTVTVVTNERVAHNLPPKAGDFPVYQYEELLRLGEIGRQHRLGSVGLHAIHEMKVALGGSVVA